MKEKTDIGKHEKESAECCKKIEEEILIHDLTIELRRELLDQGFFTLVIYLFFMDCDL